MHALLRKISTEFLIGLVVLALLIAYAFHILIVPAHAAALASTAAPVATVVQLAPFLSILVQAAGAVLLAVIAYFAPRVFDAVTQHFHLQSDATVRNALIGIAYDAAHFGINNAQAAVTRVNGIDVGDPTVAAAANWFLAHASDEIEHFNLSDQAVIGTIQAILPQVQRQIAPAQPSTVGKST